MVGAIDNKSTRSDEEWRQQDAAIVSEYKYTFSRQK
jgi:hypothetical protein